MKEVQFSTVSFSTTKLASMVALVTAVVIQGSQAEAQIYDTNNVVVQTFAGSGFYGYLDGIGQQTMFNDLTAIVADSSSNLFVWDSNNARIRKIAPDATVSTFAGGGNLTTGYGTNVALDQLRGSQMIIDNFDTIWAFSGTYLLRIGNDGYVSRTTLNYFGSSGLCFDSRTNLYFAGGNQIYRCGQTVQWKYLSVLEIPGQ
jgi:hypothetical protein